MSAVRTVRNGATDAVEALTGLLLRFLRPVPPDLRRRLGALVAKENENKSTSTKETARPPILNPCVYRVVLDQPNLLYRLVLPRFTGFLILNLKLVPMGRNSDIHVLTEFCCTFLLVSTVNVKNTPKCSRTPPPPPPKEEKREFSTVERHWHQRIAMSRT